MDEKSIANIFAVKRFAIHDGDGIRTTVFFKGCTLKCIWCHNPEGILPKPQLAFYELKCSMCGECKKACNFDVHSFEGKRHYVDYSKCVFCGDCVSACMNDALEIFSKQVTVDDLLKIVLRDRAFYKNNGGVTLSGGECLCQADFCSKLLQKLKECGINTNVDTCGAVPRKNIDKVINFTDKFLYDIKAIDEKTHIKCTGMSNKIILENLKYIDSLGKRIEIRIPYVPGYNDGEISKIGKFLQGLKNIEKVRILPYHNMAGTKYKALNMENTLPELLPESEELQKARDTVRGCGFVVAE